MRLQILFGSAIRPLSSLVALIAGLVSPKAFAEIFPLVQSLNPLETENPVKVLPKGTVFMTQPPGLPSQMRQPSLSTVIAKAFNNDDLNALYGSGAFGQCETGSRIPSFFSKNYSNFAYDCFERLQTRHSESFDERFQANPAAQGLSGSPLGGGIQWENISAPVRERLLQRSIHDLAQKNKLLSDIIQGRMSFDIGLETLWRAPSIQQNTNEQRPRFVVAVLEPTTSTKPLKTKQVASLGDINGSEFSADPSSNRTWMSNKPKKARRVLREGFDSEPRLSNVTVEGKNDSAVNEQTGGTLTSFKALARLAGLRHLPFAKINMKAERRVIDGSQQFALRATESQELFYAELPNAAQASATALNWGYKIPWKQHAISVHVNESAQEKVTAYSYKIDENNKTDVSFNHKSNAVSAGFVVSF